MAHRAPEREGEMLGEKIGETSGRVTSQRVLGIENGAAKTETSFQTRGTLLGVEFSELGTYWSSVRPDGTLFGEGQGVMMGKDGEMATWVGQGVGGFGNDGAVSYRGAVYLQSSHPKWSPLNRVALVYEHEVDGRGSTSARLFEWK
jgi:hypothetical protein